MGGGVRVEGKVGRAGGESRRATIQRAGELEATVPQTRHVALLLGSPQDPICPGGCPPLFARVEVRGADVISEV